MQMPDVDEVKHQAADAARRVGGELKENLRDQWHLVRGRSPELVYPSVAEAMAANARRVEANAAYYRENPSMVGRRVEELDDEWDSSRVLQVATSSLTLLGFWFSLTKSRLWTLVPLAMAGGTLHHGLTGESPAEDLVRRLGFRTRGEIEHERRVLLSLGGGGASSLFEDVAPPSTTGGAADLDAELDAELADVEVPVAPPMTQPQMG